MDEKALVTRAQAGDAAAFGALHEAHASYVLRIAALYVGITDAADVAQEVWVAAWRKLWQVDDPARFAAWLRKIVYYRSVNYRKRYGAKARELALSPEEWVQLVDFMVSDEPTVEEHVLSRELRRQMSEWLDALPGDYGLLLRLRYVHGLPYESIQRITEHPLSTVKWRLHEGKRLLRATLARAARRNEG